MDEICKTVEGEFKLQAQQNFLREYMRAYPDWKSLLLYHCLGSGKTCTAITMAEEYLLQNPSHHIKVILPARLRTNFLDELISPCGMGKYISKEEFVEYQLSTTPVSRKKAIKAKFMAAISEKYSFYSFERLKSEAMKEKDNIKDWVYKFTDQSMIIVDEVHNLLSDKYNVKAFTEALSTGTIKKGQKGLNTILFRLLTTLAAKTTKMIFLTATPIFDNMNQFKVLIQVMRPDLPELKNNITIKEAVEYLRGKVSYFPGTSINAYPTHEYNIIEVPLSKTQDRVTQSIIDAADDEDDAFKEQFMAKQRQASIACLENNPSLKHPSLVQKVIDDMPSYAPKIMKLVHEIESKPGKHIVYSNFVQAGLRIVEEALKKRGWIRLEPTQQPKSNKVYALWDGSIKDHEKQYIKMVANSKDNMTGEKVRLILGSPSIKEGVSFKHIQHMHLLDPVWNQSAKDQVEGRAIRYCSHIDIPRNHPVLKRNVVINIYKSVPRPNGHVAETCDQIIYDKIIVNKFKRIKLGEAALKKVAIDHYLFRQMYENSSSRPTTPIHPSPISVPDDIALNDRKRKESNKTTCPKTRRPVQDPGTNEWRCPKEDTFLKMNNQGFPCCYKIKRTKQQSKCPASRQPTPDGECPTGFILKTNKSGEPCCYKQRN
jgi:hypothetical protein